MQFSAYAIWKCERAALSSSRQFPVSTPVWLPPAYNSLQLSFQGPKPGSPLGIGEHTPHFKIPPRGPWAQLVRSVSQSLSWCSRMWGWPRGECGVSRKERQKERPASASEPSAENRKKGPPMRWAHLTRNPRRPHLSVCGLCVQSCRLVAIPQTVAHQAPLSMEFCRQEYWRGLPFPSPPHLRVVNKIKQRKTQPCIVSSPLGAL